MVKGKAEPVGGDGITVTAQQSRYAADAVDAPASTEIVVKDLSISIYQKDILNRTALILHEAFHYVLVGRNGVGKSTLLKVLAEGRIPGIPWSTKVKLLGQTSRDQHQGERAEDSLQKTVLQYVITSDQDRERMLSEFSTLSKAFDDSKNGNAVVKAYQDIAYARLQRKLKESQLIAERRSGARGAKARRELNSVEDEVEALSNKMSTTAVTDLEDAEAADATTKAAEMLADLQAALETMDDATTERKARHALQGLGFKPEMLDQKVASLSGGWRTRCEIACTLSQPGDILLLDEPTNYLDLPSILWLQNHICSEEDTTILCTTHDRDFADAIGKDLLIMRDQKLEHFKGNLTTFEKERLKNIKWMSKLKDNSEKQKVNLQQQINQNIKAAKSKGDDKKLKQAASRSKKLTERTGLEVGMSGGRFKLNRDLPGYHLTNRAEIDVKSFDPPVKLSIPEDVSDLKFAGSLLSLENVTFSYPGSKRGTTPILDGITLVAQPGERIGICGLNGAGKSTLINLILGAQEGALQKTLKPSSGTITQHARCKIGCFSQKAVEELESLASNQPDLTALKDLTNAAGGSLNEGEARKELAALGLAGTVVSDVPLALLSGGQKVRLALSKVLLSRPHLLILDEVTTHLDSDTILALVLALRKYAGALLVVTHDRFFMRCVVEGEWPYKAREDHRRDNDDEIEEDSSDEDDNGTPRPKGKVYRLFKGKLKFLENGMAQYEEIAAKALNKLSKIG